ncbi:TPA: DUF6056 family protein [Escherichia coli]|uniref:DUF3329 domain-containing protein n=1 Tax=Escherichia coli TaxID=562 RepID=UPI0037DF023E
MMRFINITTILSLLVMYVLTSVISLHTPMHSDDYTYAITGIGIESHFKHYFTWSGRIVADYVSGLLLSINHTYRSLINAAALPILSLLIAKISSYLFEQKRYQTALIGIFVYLTYWLSNTNLGQTTFWVVGSANYIWTNIFICLFFMLICRKVYAEDKKTNTIIICIVGVFAGCSNENTGFVAVLFPLFLMSWNYINKKHTSKKLLAYTISSGLGYLLLVGSPGNKERAKYFTYWFETPFIERLKEHLYHRVPDMISQLWVSLLIIAILLVIYSFIKKQDQKNNSITLAAFFMVCALLSVLIMVASPTYPPRSGNGTLVFLLISISFMLNEIIQTKNGKLLSGSLLIVIALYFIPSYMDMKKIYAMTSLQDEVRQKIINEDLKKGVQEFSIPDFYFGKMLTPSQKFDTFHSDLGYGKFYGVHKIYKAKSNFDYSSILTAKEIATDSELIPGKTKLISIYLEKSKGALILKTNKDISAYNYIHGPMIYVNVTYNNGSTKNMKFWPSSIVLSYYSWTRLEVDLNNAKSITIGSVKENNILTTITITL